MGLVAMIPHLMMVLWRIRFSYCSFCCLSCLDVLWTPMIDATYVFRYWVVVYWLVQPLCTFWYQWKLLFCSPWLSTCLSCFWYMPCTFRLIFCYALCFITYSIAIWCLHVMPFCQFMTKRGSTWHSEGVLCIVSLLVHTCILCIFYLLFLYILAYEKGV